MSSHVSDLLSDYLDDELGPRERSEIDMHLRVCAECSHTLEQLRRVVATAARVRAADTPPARDLWTGVRARIAPASASLPSVGSFEEAAARRRRRTERHIALSIPQLAAAAVLLMAISAATAWFLKGTTVQAPTGPGLTPVIAEIEQSPAPDTVRRVNFADAQYDAAVADLERALNERRNDLNPRTVEILERNLRLIDAAIAQARQALDEDPGNAYLNRHLVESRRRKLELLRRATALSQGN
jgi:hypothetical protein